MKEFDSIEAQTPPPHVNQTILARIKTRLHPSPRLVFGKLLAVHAATAVFTLSICPQFGIRLLGDGAGLMSLFMSFGTAGCSIACGFFFLAASMLVSAVLLRTEELRVAREWRVTQSGALVLASIALLVLARAEPELLEAALWSGGAIAGALIMLELGWRVRAVPAYR